MSLSLTPEQDYENVVKDAPSNLNLGQECAGLITRVGAKAKLQFQIGDRVLCWSPGSLASHVKTDARHCIQIPDNISTDQALSLSVSQAAAFRGSWTGAALQLDRE